jgi:pterin-4a-carbinolamine dehydratase
VAEYSRIIQAAGALVGAADTEEARRAVDGVLWAVASALREPERRRLAEALPGALRPDVEIRGPSAPVSSGGDVVLLVSERTGTTTERARFYTQAVLSTLADEEPELGHEIAAQLPDGADLVAPIDQGVPPRGSGVPIDYSPVILERDEIDRALTRLTDWTGDEHRLRRTVELPPDRITPLRNAVARAERELSHNARLHEDPPGTVTFEVWTHSLDRVTDMDVDLARRIDQAVDAVGANG